MAKRSLVEKVVGVIAPIAMVDSWFGQCFEKGRSIHELAGLPPHLGTHHLDGHVEVSTLLGKYALDLSSLSVNDLSLYQTLACVGVFYLAFRNLNRGYRNPKTSP